MLWKKFDISLQIVKNVSRFLQAEEEIPDVKKPYCSYLCTDGKPIGTSPLLLATIPLFRKQPTGIQDYCSQCFCPVIQ
jgi:hypothetical protein